MVSIVVYGAVLAVTGVFTYPALIATRLIGAPVVTAIAFELQRQASRHAEGRLRFLSWPGMWAQKLTTAPPDPAELEVACAALEAALTVPEESVRGGPRRGSPPGLRRRRRARGAATAAHLRPPRRAPGPVRRAWVFGTLARGGTSSLGGGDA